MRQFIKIGQVEIGHLKDELKACPELWGQFGIRKTGVHEDMTDIWVRYNAISNFDPNDPAAFNGPHIPVWYPAWTVLPALRSIVFWLMTRVQGEMLGGILITRIPSGLGIHPHKDASWHVDYFDKFYVSIESEAGAAFIDVDSGERLEPRPGEVWRYDNTRFHAVKNNSQADRVTLIVCIRTEMFRGL